MIELILYIALWVFLPIVAAILTVVLFVGYIILFVLSGIARRHSKRLIDGTAHAFFDRI